MAPSGNETVHANGNTILFSGAGGVRLRATRYGDPLSPPALLLHGGGQTRYAWADTATALAEAGYCACTIDARGHGDSDWSPDGDYRADMLAADLAEVIRSLDADPVIIGASMGGLTAILTLGEDPTLTCRALVLVDVAPRLERAGVRRIIEFMLRHQDGFASLEQVRDAISAYNPHRSPPEDLSGLRKNLRQRADGRYYWHWDPAFLDHARMPVHDEEMFNVSRLNAAAQHINAPTLLIRGHQSDVLSDTGARELLSIIPHARYAVLDKAGHMVAGDRNTAFTETVLNFLTPLEMTGKHRLQANSELTGVTR